MILLCNSGEVAACFFILWSECQGHRNLPIHRRGARGPHGNNILSFNHLSCCTRRDIGQNLPALSSDMNNTVFQSAQGSFARRQGAKPFLTHGGVLPRLPVGVKLVMQTNKHTSPCMIKESIMLTFTQRGQLHVGATTVARSRWSSGETKTEAERSERRGASPVTPVQQFLTSKEREWKEGERAQEVCSEQTTDNGVWASGGGVFSIVRPREREQVKGREKRRRWSFKKRKKKWTITPVCVCVCKQRGSFKAVRRTARCDHDSHEMTFMRYLLTLRSWVAHWETKFTTLTPRGQTAREVIKAYCYLPKVKQHRRFPENLLIFNQII